MCARVLREFSRTSSFSNLQTSWDLRSVFFLNINHVYLHNFMKWSILCKIMAMVVKDCRTEVLLALGDFGSSFKNWKAEYCLALDGSRALSQNFDINTAIHQVSMSAW